MKLDDIRHGVGALWDSVAEGWDRLRQTTAGALTRRRLCSCSRPAALSLPAPTRAPPSRALPLRPF